jgi:hypothetical protein
MNIALFVYTFVAGAASTSIGIFIGYRHGLKIGAARYSRKIRGEREP